MSSMPLDENPSEWLYFALDHTVHHLLTLFALGATPEEIKAAYDLNKGYQLLTKPHPASFAVRLKDPEFFDSCLRKPKFYGDFLKFFQDEIAERGVPSVVNEYIFKGDERADQVLGQMFSGKKNPAIVFIYLYFINILFRIFTSSYTSRIRSGIPSTVSCRRITRSCVYS